MQVHEKNVASVPVLAHDGTEGGKLFFIPADVAMQVRAKTALEGFLTLSKALEGQRLTEDGNGVGGPSKAAVNEANKRFAELLDYVCGISGSGQEAFRQYNPFASMPNGEFWADSVMAALSKAVDTVSANIRETNQVLKKKWR